MYKRQPLDPPIEHQNPVEHPLEQEPDQTPPDPHLEHPDQVDDNRPDPANDHAQAGPPIRVRYPENVPVMGTPPPAPQPTQDLPERDDNLTQNDPSLPRTEAGDFSSSSDDSDSSFKTVGQPSPYTTRKTELHTPDAFPPVRRPLADYSTSTSFQPDSVSTPIVPTSTGAIPKTHRYNTRIGPRASASAGTTPKVPRRNTRGTVSADHTPPPATRAQHKRMGTDVPDPSYLPTTVEHMARKQLAQTAAEQAAATAADPFQPAPLPSSSRLDTTQRYARFATSTAEWEARNLTRLEALKYALAEKDKKRKGNQKE